MQLPHAIALLSLVGCGRLGFDALAGDSGSTNGDGSSVDALVPGCQANETTLMWTTTFDALPAWGFIYGGTPEVRIANAELEITPQPNVAAVKYWGIVDTTLVDHRGRRMMGEISSVVTGFPGTQSLFRFTTSVEDGAQMFVTNTTLIAEILVTAVQVSGQSLPYDPVAHRWWQVRETAGMVYFEVSPNGIDWTVVHSDVTPAFFSMSTVELAAGYYTAQTMPLGAFHVDNLFVCE